MDKVSIQEALVSNFIKLLGAKGQGSRSTSAGITTISGDASSASAADFAECLSDDATSTDIVCTIPCMEMNLDAKAKEALPNVGNHFSIADKPTMTATVLTATSEASENTSKMEEAAAKTLGNITSWTKSTLIHAPPAAAKNIAVSFSSLVAARVRAWTLLLLRHSLTTGNSSSRSQLLSMLSSDIDIISMQTSFTTLPLPESAREHQKEADVILPLLFEAKLQICIQGKDDVVFLRAPGTVSGHFSKGFQPGLVKVDIRLDTNALFNTMVEQARLVVFKAVSQATNVGSPKGPIDTGAANVPTPMDACRKEQSSETRPDTRALSSFSSALSLSAKAAEDSPRLAKARHSALKLNSILQGTSSANVGDVQPQPTNKFRKIRSVQWDTALDVKKNNNFPPTKRQRQVQSNSRLRSFKSFGRPHGSDGRREAKNATFGDFGRSPSGPIWGKNGKLLNHPTPGGLVSSTLSTIALESSGPVQSNQNATFDVPPKTMKRTATALESWLVQNATGR
mmetsp:Transcript_13923/g.20562  ORF Transcript_13923/g.20562 Transcript_13923/m.20562 type:complete len:511 (-) Transcript_13923:151-1683(-)